MGRGGAEVMLIKLIKELTGYNNIVVTLNPKNNFEKEELEGITFHTLNMGSFSKFYKGAWRLRHFIKNNNISLVHSHLFTATLVARLGTPQHIPLITTIHTDVAASDEYNKWYMRMLEKLSYTYKKSTIVGVSKVVLNQYIRHFNHKPYRLCLLHTFADTDKLQPQAEKKTGNSFKLISIGALRYPKNQEYLIKAFEQLKDENITLDIYGRGSKEQLLQQMINTTGVKVSLKGEVKNAGGLIPQYDVFVMSSKFEGFSLSVLEAMTMKVPLLLSDIPSFKEQCPGTALFFDLNDTTSFVNQLKRLLHNEELRQLLAQKAYTRLINNFTIVHHLKQLKKIYTDTLNENE
jgi:glycosyltransferase involved in cell wall biosynthesis